MKSGDALVKIGDSLDKCIMGILWIDWRALLTEISKTSISFDSSKDIVVCLGKTLLSSIHTWFLDKEADEIATSFGLSPSKSSLMLAFPGAISKVSCFSSSRTIPSVWTLSPFATAFRLLCLVSLLSSFSAKENVEAAKLLSFYLGCLPEKVGVVFKMPNLTFLSKFWLDSCGKFENLI